MTRFVRLLLTALAALPVVPAADGPRAETLVELYTSQGCSSCPPANRLMHEIDRREDAIVLAFHVDYWDYLGWQDTFAAPEHTARQRSYRDAWDASVIYTPQVVIAGQVSVPATRRAAVEGAIDAASAVAKDLSIHIERSAGMLRARLEPGQARRPCTVWVAKYRKAETVAVERGENAGRRLEYHNVVTGLDRIGTWDGTAGETVILPQPAVGEGVAVWLQDGPGGPVLAAARHEN